MGFIKKNAFLLACATVAVLSLVFMFWGMSRMSAVQAEMNQVKQLETQLARYTRDAANPAAVEEENERIDTIYNYHREVMGHFEELNERQPIMEDLLPEARTKTLPYEFPDRYRAAMQRFLTMLGAGQPPTPKEIEDTSDWLKRKALEAQQFGGQGQPTPPAGQAGRQGAPPQSNLPELPEISGPETVKEYWRILEERVKQDASVLTSIGKARDIKCYAKVAPPEHSFELSALYQNTDELPSMADIWWAQLWYWIQEDLVKAIAEVNDRAAQDVEKPWVGNMPVKDILSIRLSTYVKEGEGQALPGTVDLDAPYPPKTADAAFTEHHSEALFDVMNIRLRLVIDQRDLPKILNAFCDQEYYTVLNVGYEALAADLNFEGKIYGPEPVVKAVFDLQTYLYWRSYVRYMPQVIREQLGISDKTFDDLMESLKEEEPETESDAAADAGT